jgi:hypothetical protein
VRQDWPADLLKVPGGTWMTRLDQIAATPLRISALSTGETVALCLKKLRDSQRERTRLLFRTLSATPMNDSPHEIDDLLKLLSKKTCSKWSPLDEQREFKTFLSNFYDRLPRIFTDGVGCMDDLCEYTSRLRVTADGDALVIEAVAVLSEMIYAGVVRRERESQPRSRLTIRELCRELFGSEEIDTPSQCGIPDFVGLVCYQPLSSATPTERHVCENLSRKMSEISHARWPL